MIEGKLDEDVSINTSNHYLSLLSDAVSDGFDVIHYLWETKARTSEDYVEVKDTEIAHLLGFKKKANGSYHEKARQKVSDIMKVLSAVSVDLKASITRKYNKGGKAVKDTIEINSNLLTIRSRIKKTREVGKVEKWQRLSWTVKPGDALLPFLDRPNRQFAQINKKLLSYRSTKRRLAKRIGRSGTYFLRANFQRSQGIKKISVQALLKDAGVCFAKSNPRRFIDQFEEARETLLRDGIFKSMNYEDPQIFEMLADSSYTVNLSERWLSAIIVIEAPDKVVAAYKKMLNKNNSLQQQVDPLCAIKKLLENGKTKTEIAATLGIGKSYLSMIVNGKRAISDNIIAKVKSSGLLHS